MTQHFVYSAIAGALIEVSPREAQQFRAAHDAHYALNTIERTRKAISRNGNPSAGARVEVAGGPEQAAGCESLTIAQGVTR